MERVKPNVSLEVMTPKKYVYCVGDLAFYAMVLGKEHSSGKWCYLCQLAAKDFKNLLIRRESWTYELMNELVETIKMVSLAEE